MTIDQKRAGSSVSNCARASYRKWAANFAVEGQGRQGSVNEQAKRDLLLRLMPIAAVLAAGDNTTRNPIIYLQQVEGRYTGVYLTEGSDLQADREASADLASVDRWLSSGRRVFIISPQREIDLAEKVRAQGRFSLNRAGLLYEVRYAREVDD